MSSLNKAILIGHLGQDPEVRYTQNNTPVANFSIATTEKYKDSNGEYQENTEWHKIVAWSRLAEIVQEFLTKGSPVYIEGSIGTREWEDKDGIKRYSTEITAQKLLMLGSKGDQSSDRRPQPAQPKSKSEPQFDDVDDDLPF